MSAENHRTQPLLDSACNYPNCDGGYATGYCHNGCLPKAPKAMDLQHALEYAAEALRKEDGGDMTTATGWRSDELLSAWLGITAAIANGASQ